MLVEEELVRKPPAKGGSNWKGNHQKKDKKASSS